MVGVGHWRRLEAGFWNRAVVDIDRLVQGTYHPLGDLEQLLVVNSGGLILLGRSRR